MKQVTISLIEAERTRQDDMLGNTNNHSAIVWVGLIVKQLGSAVGISQDWLFNTHYGSQREKYLRKQYRKQVIQAAALCVAWLEDIIDHEELDG